MSGEITEILRNLPGDPHWEGSFYEQLTEYAIWDENAFWRLHLALLEAAKTPRIAFSRENVRALVSLQGKVLNLISAHYNPGDAFNIRNLSHERLQAFDERFQHAVLSVFSGEVTPETSYDLVNPLIVHA